MAAEVKRASRVAGAMREELAVLVQRARDPRIAGTIVSRVELSDDLRNARVYVRLLAVDTDDARRDEALAGLASAAGMLRREVTRKLKLRYAPELRFFYDAGQDKRDRIEALLDEVRREREASEPPDDE